MRPAPPPRPRRSPRTLFLWGGLAAGVAVIAVGLAASSSYERRLDDLARQAAVLRDELGRQQSVVAILRDPATRLIALSGQAPSPRARGWMMWHATAGGIFVTAGLPALPPGQAYQLWAVAGRRAPVSAGVFSVDVTGAGSLRVPPLAGLSRVDGLAVTLEPAGGRAAPSGARYLAGKR